MLPYLRIDAGEQKTSGGGLSLITEMLPADLRALIFMSDKYNKLCNLKKLGGVASMQDLAVIFGRTFDEQRPGEDASPEKKKKYKEAWEKYIETLPYDTKTFLTSYFTSLREKRQVSSLFSFVKVSDDPKGTQRQPSNTVYDITQLYREYLSYRDLFRDEKKEEFADRIQIYCRLAENNKEGLLDYPAWNRSMRSFVRDNPTSIPAGYGSNIPIVVLRTCDPKGLYVITKVSVDEETPEGERTRTYLVRQKLEELEMRLCSALPKLSHLCMFIDDGSRCGDVHVNSTGGYYFYVHRWWIGGNLNEKNELVKNALYTLNLSKWDVSNIETANDAFASLSGFRGDGLENWQLPNLDYASSMFWNCTEFNANVAKWMPNNLRIAEGMFAGCEKYEGCGIENWVLSNIDETRLMFDSCREFNANVAKWMPEKLTDAHGMFSGCEKFECDGIEAWTVPDLTEAYGMFYKTPLPREKIEDWTVGYETLIERSHYTSTA